MRLEAKTSSTSSTSSLLPQPYLPHRPLPNPVTFPVYSLSFSLPLLFNHSPSSPAFSPLTLFTQSRFSWLNPCALPQDCSSCNCSTVSSLRPLASSPITPCSSSHTSVAFLAPPPSSLVVSQKEVTRSFKLVLLGPSIPSALHCSSKSSIKSTTSAGLVPSWLLSSTSSTSSLLPRPYLPHRPLPNPVTFPIYSLSFSLPLLFNHS